MEITIIGMFLREIDAEVRGRTGVEDVIASLNAAHVARLKNNRWTRRVQQCQGWSLTRRIADLKRK